ncbi:unnamed protein product [Spirodela intermedia]|uniref:Uncharacterized protein n=1 Tax=Spirodela intermedia TaxID=51605 RepID=A0A7I8KNA9_SPIIN|nr:unnamed protein product [Spirodela intermedia]
MFGEAIWESPGDDGVLRSSFSSSSLGQVMHTILSSRPRHLKAAIAELGPSPSKSASGALLDESLCFLWRHVEDAAKKEEPLDHVLVPLIERSKEPKGSKQVFILIGWLCRNELLLQAILINLIEIITTKADHFTAFGWCTFVKSLVELSSDRFFEGEEERHHLTLLKILCRSIPRLLVITCEGSTLVDGFELPTRLAVAAADCTLVLTEALTKKEFMSSSQKPLTDSKKKNELIKMISLSDNEKERNQTQVTDTSDDIGSEFLLWHYLNELVILVEKLEAWSRKSLPLQEKGLKQVRKWLLEIKEYYSFVQDEAGGESLRNGVLLLSSCWKHYGMLLRFEKYKSSQDCLQVLDQYLSALEFYTQHDADGDPMKVTSSIETRKFFLNCIALFWGKLPAEQRKTATSETGIKLVNALLSQLKCDREDLVEISVSIMREVIFRTDFQSGGCAVDTHQLQHILPTLLSFLDERDSTAKAVILLLAEFCYVRSRDGPGIMEILKLLASGSHNQKKNAVDVIVELVHGYSDAKNKISPALWQDIAKHLLECLGDEELIDNVLASNLFPCLDPSFVLPQLIHLSYSGNEKVSFSSATALSSVLSHHNDFSVIEMLVDSLSDLMKNPDFSLKAGTSEKNIEGKSPLLQSGPKLDIDRVLKLTPGWSESVKKIDILIDQLIEKMFLNPSNHVLLRFMSYLSERLAEAGDLVLHRVLVHMQGQDMDESWVSDRSKESFESDNAIRLKSSVFSRLCPLLILRLLPLKIFDNLGSSTLYGVFPNEENWKAQKDACMSNRESIAPLLINRAFGLFEYEDVRKLAAELCGRLHPQVLIPIVAYHIRSASESRDALKLKACLFAVCTSLVGRGAETASHPSMAEIRQVIDSVLSWPSVGSDEVPKAQHGCVDCLALMICAEVQSPEPLRGPRNHPGSDALAGSAVLTRVMQRLASESPSPDHHELGSSPASRLFMASVLISACQKVASSERSELARRILSALIPSIESIADSEVRPACLQVLFSAVYHLKSSVLQYSMDLFKLSIKALKKGSEKEKIAAAKLLVALMASEDGIVERISTGLIEAKSTLASISMADSSSRELRQLCEKLLACLTSPLEGLMLGAYRPAT